MKIYNDYKVEILPVKMQLKLEELRIERNFNVKEVLKSKIQKLNKYFSQYNLSTAVVGVSGGVDSALVIAILKAASEVENSSIKNIIPVTIPAYESSGVTGQKESVQRAKELAKEFSLELVELDLSSPVISLSKMIEKTINKKSDDWAEGQLTPYMRTAALYYYTTLYTQHGDKAVLMGTTNADEGQYIGYFGKASDGMTDLQLISDLHKSEVYEMAEYLNVPKSILLVPPTGDMYDGRLDEEVFGAPYGFIELYSYYLNFNENEKEIFVKDLKFSNELDIFENLKNNVETMHRYNKHKYLGNSPAVHLDVLDAKVKNGWKYSIYEE